MDGLSTPPFEVFRMEMDTLEQPMANNECGFYIMWTMYHYIGGKTKTSDELVCILPISCISIKQITVFSYILLISRQRQKIKRRCLLEPKIRGFQDALAGFILDEVCSKNGVFSLFRAKSKDNKLYARAAADRLL